jgi:hypothetical protein
MVNIGVEASHSWNCYVILGSRWYSAFCWDERGNISDRWSGIDTEIMTVKAVFISDGQTSTYLPIVVRFGVRGLGVISYYTFETVTDEPHRFPGANLRRSVRIEESIMRKEQKCSLF